MNILFGGSFNPPTIAHQAIIGSLSQMYDIIYIVPNGDKYLLKDIVDYQARVEMLTLITKKYPNVIISGIEGNRPFKGTIQTLRDLHHPTLAIGDDCLKDLENWIDSETLLKENTFLVYTRSMDVTSLYDYIDNNKFLKPYLDKFSFVSLTFHDVSSSLFRKTLDYSLLPTEVEAYIKKHQLYKKIE